MLESVLSQRPSLLALEGAHCEHRQEDESSPFTPPAFLFGKVKGIRLTNPIWWTPPDFAQPGE
jgi:hypothetical protein